MFYVSIHYYILIETYICVCIRKNSPSNIFLTTTTMFFLPFLSLPSRTTTPCSGGYSQGVCPDGMICIADAPCSDEAYLAYLQGNIASRRLRQFRIQSNRGTQAESIVAAMSPSWMWWMRCARASSCWRHCGSLCPGGVKRPCRLLGCRGRIA